ncbi:MAG: SCO family protein [Phycisphaerales bacterium]|nr:SCO family protein [Phycisphaerales bacterium]
MPDSRGLPKIVLALALVAVAGMAVSGVMLIRGAGAAPDGRSPSEPDPREPDPGLEGIRIPAFSLVDQSGARVDERLLLGHVTIVAFIFTNCRLICPGMSARMVQLQNDLKDTPVRLLSLSVDSAHDTPEVLAAYAARIGADLDRWTFVSDDGATTRTMLRQIGFDVSDTGGEEIALPDGSRMSDINHPAKLMLVDESGRVLGLYGYADAEAMTRLAARARALCD